MAVYRLAVLLLAAQVAAGSAAAVYHTHLRAESAPQKPDTLTVSNHIWNNTMTRFVQQEIVLTEANPPLVDKVIYVLLAMVFGLCGCDRCYMGQVLLGCLKGFTAGGFMIWHFIDYFTAFYCALAKMKRIDMMGYHATFKPESIDNAFYLCIILLIIDLYRANQTRNQHQSQMEQQEAMLKAMNASGNQQESLNVPRSHQVLAHAPTPLAKALRKAGAVEKHATVPELIAAFTSMDKDGDGQLDREELKASLSSMGVSDEDVNTMIKEADKDGDGKISKDEFLAYHARKAAEKAAKKEAEREAYINPDVA